MIKPAISLDWVALGEPVPLESARIYRPFEWPVNAIMSCGNYSAAEIKIDPVYLFKTRRSRRRLESIGLSDISNLCCLISRASGWGSDVLGFRTYHCPAPSAGGIHPIHLLFSSITDEYWMHYSPEHHLMNCLSDILPSPKGLRSRMSDHIEPSAATIVLFVGEPGKTGAKYANPSSLIWRDAGNLQGIMTIAAEVLALGFCQLGLTGDEWVQQFDNQRRLVGLGVALLGKISVDELS